LIFIFEISAKNCFFYLIITNPSFSSGQNRRKKAVCRSVFLTTWHCILSAQFTKTHSFRLLFSAILLTGNSSAI